MNYGKGKMHTGCLTKTSVVGWGWGYVATNQGVVSLSRDGPSHMALGA